MDNKKVWLFVKIIAFIALLLGLYFHGKDKPVGPLGKDVEKELWAELNAVQPLPQAFLKSTYSSHKSSQAVVIARYVTSLSYNEIRGHYDQELPQHGWQFVKEKKIYFGGKDYGGMSVHYQKGEYYLSINYTGSRQEKVGFTYDVSLSWGLAKP